MDLTNEPVTSAVMVIERGGKYLAVPHLDGMGLPGGKIEPSDRDSMAAAIREAMEETGFLIKRCVFVFRAPVDGHICDCYLATATVDASMAKDGNNLWHLNQWMTPEELLSVKRGEVRFPEWNREMFHQLSMAKLFPYV